MSSNNQIHFNPKFLQNNTPKIFINPECIKIGNGISKPVNTQQHITKDVSLPSLHPVKSFQPQTSNHTMQSNSKLTNFASSHGLPVNGNDKLKNSEKMLLSYEANNAYDNVDKNMTITNKLLKFGNGAGNEVVSSRKINKFANYTKCQNNHHSNNQFRYVPKSDQQNEGNNLTSTFLPNQYKFSNTKNIRKLVAHNIYEKDTFVKTKKNLTRSDIHISAMDVNTTMKNKYKYVKSRVSPKSSRNEVMSRNGLVPGKSSPLDSGATNSKKLNVTSHNQYKYISLNSLPKSHQKIMSVENIMSDKCRNHESFPYQNKYRLSNSKSYCKSPTKEVRKICKANPPPLDCRKKLVIFPLQNQYKLSNSKSSHQVERRIVTNVRSSALQGNSKYIWNHINAQTKHLGLKAPDNKQVIRPLDVYRNKLCWTKQGYGVGNFSKSKFPHSYTPIKPANRNQCYSKKSKWHAQEYFTGQQYKTPSLYKTRRDAVKQYINIYKNRSFFNNSSHKQAGTLRNQSLTNFRVINIGGKAYCSNSTSLKRRSISNSFNPQLTTHRKMVASHKYKKENRYPSDKSSLKPGTLIEIVRKRKMALLKLRTEGCRFYRRHGYCNRHQKKICPFVHKKENAPVCTRFLTGDCKVEKCPFSHLLDKNKMPACCHFVQGSCTRPACPYRHVKVNPAAPVCQYFLEGNCPEGDACRKQHVFICGDYEQTGECPKGKECPLKHRKRRKAPRPLRIRTSIPNRAERESNQILGCEAVASDGADGGKDNCRRYFDNSITSDSPTCKQPNTEDSSPTGETKRISNRLRKRKLPKNLPSYIPLFLEDLNLLS